MHVHHNFVDKAKILVEIAAPFRNEIRVLLELSTIQCNIYPCIKVKLPNLKSLKELKWPMDGLKCN